MIDQRRNRFYLGLSCFLVLGFFQNSIGQNQGESTDLYHNFTLKTKFHQLKDDYNYGRVFNGLLVGFDYELSKQKSRTKWRYGAGLDFGPSYKIGLGLCWDFVPAEFQYLFKLKGADFWLGPYGSLNYSWQLYPELQSGRMFWNSSFEVGSVLTYHQELGNRPFTFTLSCSMFGVNSRPAYQSEQYHYSLKANDFISNPHRNLSLLFLNSYQHLEFEVIRHHRIDKKVSLGYSFEYIGRSKDPAFQFFSHAIHLIWTISKNEK